MEEKIYNKVCKLCGNEFLSEQPRKRYCPECSDVMCKERVKKKRQIYKKPKALQTVPKVKKVTKKEHIAPDMRRCKDCFYGAILDNNYQICDYISITGHSRPCLPGADCTVFEPKGNRKKVKKAITFGRVNETEFGAYVQDSMFRTEKKRRRSRFL